MCAMKGDTGAGDSNQKDSNQKGLDVPTADARKSSIWVQQLFKKESTASDYEDMPEWYRRALKNRVRSSRVSKIIDSKHHTGKRPTHSRVQTHSIIKQKSKAKLDDDGPQNCGLRKDFCHNDVAKLRLEFEKTDEDGPEENRWICRHPDPEPRRKKHLTDTDILLQKIDKKCNEAMLLLIDKMDKGLLPRTVRQKCDPNFQYGIDLDETPSPSRCVLSSESQHSECVEGTVPEDPEKLETTSKDNIYCPIVDKEVANYLMEHTAEYLLKKIRAIDENGNLLCDLCNFDHVEHCVKNLLIQLAEEQSENPEQRHKTHWEPQSSATQKNFRRAHIKHVLKKEMRSSSSHPAQEVEPKKRSTATGLVLDVQRRGMHSVGPQHVQEVVDRLKSGMDRKSDLHELPEPSILEILPFQFRESFDDDPHSGISPIKEPKRKSESLIDGLIPAEFKSTDNDTLPTCLTEQTTKALRFNEWENRKLCEELKAKGNLSKKEKRLWLKGKYFYLWLDKTRQHIDWRTYSHCNLKSLWAGPYPFYALNLIREELDQPNFMPKSQKHFYEMVRKLEWNMFDNAKALLEGQMGEGDSCKPVQPT